MNGIKRNTLRLVWVLLSLGLIVSGIFGFRAASAKRLQIDQANLDLDAAYRELENAQRLSAAMTELDNHTLNENTSTRLEILRHLGLEQSDYEVDIQSRQDEQIGEGTMYVRTLGITAVGTYPAMLALLDRLHNTGKFVLTRIYFENAATDEQNGVKLPVGTVKMTLDGNIYALKKKATS